jgi:hypothetical protein
MPQRWVARGVSLKCIRECVKKMLTTRRQHLAVLLQVAPEEMSLLSTQYKKLISYSREELYYCGVHMEDERYFGFVTRHQQMVVDPQVGQTVNEVEGEQTSNWVNHCHVFQVVPGQSTIAMTFQQTGSSLKRETTTSVRSANTIVNYIRQMYNTGNSTSFAREGVPPRVPPVINATPSNYLLPEFAKVTSNGSTISSSSDSSPNVQRRSKDLVDLRPPVENSESTGEQIFVDSPIPPIAISLNGSSHYDSHGSQPSSVRCETGLEGTESTPSLQLTVEDMPTNGIHGPLGEFERNGLPPKNSGISGSLDSVMTATTTADNTFDNAPQVGSWVASFDKLLKDPAGVQCFQQFLLGEFSDENIKFWLEVEKYRVKHPKQFKAAAKRIYTVFVDPTAAQPVNLDGSTVKAIEQHLDSPSAVIFNEAQKQIYSLMRLDSYQRFKRSSLLQQCLLAEMDNRPLPISLPEDSISQDTNEDRDKVTPLQPLKVTEEKPQPTKKGRDGWFFFNRRTHSFRNNSKQKSGFGSYSTHEEKKKSVKVNRDKTKGNGVARVDPEPRTQEPPKGFQGHEEEDHLDLFNDKYGPCFGIVLQEKVSKILPVPTSGTVRDALYSVIVKQNKLSLDTLDIRYADSMQPVDLEDPANVLNRHYIIVKQSLDFFHAIFPGKEIPVHADPNKTVLEVMEPILAENSLDKAVVAFYMYGARQPLSMGTYAGLLKGRKIHVKLQPRPGVPNSHTNSSIASSDSVPSFHSSSNSLNQKSSTVAANTSGNNNNSEPVEPAEEEDFLDMLMRLQSDTLNEQRSNPISSPRPLSSSVSAFTFTDKKKDTDYLSVPPNRDRHTSDPSSPTKKKSANLFAAAPTKHRMFRTMSGSEPSLANQVELVGRRAISPAPEFSLSQDVVDEVPKFTVEVVNQYPQNRRRSYAPPPTTSPPPLSTRGHRSVSPPPQQRPPSLPRNRSYSSAIRSTSPLTLAQISAADSHVHPSPGRERSRASTGNISIGRNIDSREVTPTSGYQSKSGTPESSVISSHTSHLDRVIQTANTHHLSRNRRESKGSSSSEGTYVSMHQGPPQTRAHRPVQQYNSEPYSELSQPQPGLQKWRHTGSISVHMGMSEEERRLLQKGEQLLEKEFEDYQSGQNSFSLSQPAYNYPLQRNHPSRKHIPRHSPIKQWDKNGSMV